MLKQRRDRRRVRCPQSGFSLMELMIVIVMSTIMLTLGFTGLRKAQTSGSSRGMATAVAAELQLAREKAIAKGSPVAVVFKQGVSRSLFFLEGETEPAVTRTVNYSGDYPDGAITVATYPGPKFGASPDVPGSKSRGWQDRMASWLPDKFKNDSVFMFIPNGTVITNGLPSVDSGYRVIVATGAEVNGAKLVAAGEPQTISISQSGAVESTGRLLGYSGAGVNTAGALSPPVKAPPAPVTSYVEKIPVILDSRVTPPAQLVDGKPAYVLEKGEYLTLEVFAHSTDGRPLYAGWKDNPLTKAGPDVEKYKGAFSVPGAALERMEFYPTYNVLTSDGKDRIEANVWRSVWTWTPPALADPGDNYLLAVDVTDATANKRAVIKLPEPVIVSSPGEIVFESDRTGSWQLFTMLADGSNQTQLTSGAHQYRCASATANGKMIAFERDGSEVWIMNSDGTGPALVASGAVCPTISPTGNTIAFMRGGALVVKRLDTGSKEIDTPSAQTAVAGEPKLSNRIAYSANGKWIYYTAPGKDRVYGVRISSTGSDLKFREFSKPTASVPNTKHSPEVGGVFAGRQGQVYYHADDADPYIGRYEATGTGELGATTDSYRKSVGQLESFPAVSPYEDLLLYCESAGGKYQIMRTGASGTAWTNSGVGVALTGVKPNQGENLRPAWIRQDKGF